MYDIWALSPGAATRGGGGDVPPLAFKEGEGGEEEKDVFGPEGPKNMKNNGYQLFFFANFRNSKGVWNLFLNNLGNLDLNYLGNHFFEGVNNQTYQQTNRQNLIAYKKENLKLQIFIQRKGEVRHLSSNFPSIIPKTTCFTISKLII